MTARLATRMTGLRASEIREILKVTQRPEVISFAGGLPAPELFPVAELEEAAAHMLRTVGPQALQYSTTEGHAPLRAKIAARMNARLGARVVADEVIVTAGSQQGLDLTGRVFLDEGDEVLCESPTYLGAIQALRAYGARFVEVATDDDGLVPDDLARQLAAHPRAKLLYVVPDFQNPSGRSWTLARRRRVLDVLAGHDAVVLEDCPYRDLRFEGADLPALKSLDTRGQVVFAGSFSKVFCPGLRLGWIAAEPSLLEKYVLVKQGADLHTSSLSQLLLDRYLDTHDLDAAVARIREVYRPRRDAMVAAAEAVLPEGASFTRPHGGLFVWVSLPEGLDGHRLLERALERNVAFVPGGPFFPGGGHANHLRLNFSCMPGPRIAEGMARLGEVIGQALTGRAAATAGGR